MKKIILGVVGEMGSGKSTVASYLQQKYDAGHYRYSDILRDVLTRLSIPHTRDNLIDLFLVLAPRFGEDVLARPMKQAVEKDSHPIVVVEGIRREADIAELKQLPNFYLVGVSSESRARYDRIHARGENADDKTKTYEEFLKDHKKDTETYAPGAIKNADFVIDNTGTLDDLKARIDEIISNVS